MMVPVASGLAITVFKILTALDDAARRHDTINNLSGREKRAALLTMQRDSPRLDKITQVSAC